MVGIQHMTLLAPQTDFMSAMFLPLLLAFLPRIHAGVAPFVMPSCPSGRLPLLRLGDVVNCHLEEDDCPDNYKCVMIEHYTGCCAQEDKSHSQKSTSSDPIDATARPGSLHLEDTDGSSQDESRRRSKEKQRPRGERRRSENQRSKQRRPAGSRGSKRRRPVALRTTLITRQPNHTEVVRELFISPDALPDGFFTSSLRDRTTPRADRTASLSEIVTTTTEDGLVPPSPTPTIDNIELPALTPIRYRTRPTFAPGPGRGLHVISFTETDETERTRPPSRPKPEITGIRRLVTLRPEITTRTLPAELIVLTPRRWRPLPEVRGSKHASTTRRPDTEINELSRRTIDPITATTTEDTLSPGRLSPLPESRETEEVTSSTRNASPALAESSRLTIEPPAVTAQSTLAPGQPQSSRAVPDSREAQITSFSPEPDATGSSRQTVEQPAVTGHPTLAPRPLRPVPGTPGTELESTTRSPNPTLADSTRLTIEPAAGTRPLRPVSGTPGTELESSTRNLEPDVASSSHQTVESPAVTEQSTLAPGEPRPVPESREAELTSFSPDPHVSGFSRQTIEPPSLTRQPTLAPGPLRPVPGTPGTELESTTRSPEPDVNGSSRQTVQTPAVTEQPTLTPGQPRPAPESREAELTSFSPDPDVTGSSHQTIETPVATRRPTLPLRPLRPVPGTPGTELESTTRSPDRGITFSSRQIIEPPAATRRPTLPPRPLRPVPGTPGTELESTTRSSDRGITFSSRQIIEPPVATRRPTLAPRPFRPVPELPEPDSTSRTTNQVPVNTRFIPQAVIDSATTTTRHTTFSPRSRPLPDSREAVPTPDVGATEFSRLNPETTTLTTPELLVLTPKRWRTLTPPTPWRLPTIPPTTPAGPTPKLLNLTPKRWGLETTTPWVKHTTNAFVDILNGVFIPGIRRQQPSLPFDSTPTCGKQPFKQLCPDGTKSQYTLRWYLKDGMCCSYPYGHCKGDEIAKETALRTRADCQAVCVDGGPPTDTSTLGTDTTPNDSSGGSTPSLSNVGVEKGDPGTRFVVDESEFTCNKQPYKQVCDTGSRSQYTIRWYVKGGMCCSYPWGHCKGDEIAKEKVIRTKEQCERLCLGNR